MGDVRREPTINYPPARASAQSKPPRTKSRGIHHEDTKDTKKSKKEARALPQAIAATRAAWPAQLINWIYRLTDQCLARGTVLRHKASDLFRVLGAFVVHLLILIRLRLPSVQ